MTNRARALFIVIAGAASIRCALAQYQCGVARDLAMQAIENLKETPQRSDVEDGLQLLKHAEQTCPTLGDVWYYRSLFESWLAQLEDKSGASASARQHERLAASSLTRAKILSSEAMDSGLSPFKLVAPAEIASTAGPVQQKWALVIGVGTFPKSDADALPHAEDDARELASTLQNPLAGRFPKDVEHVRVLTGSEATLANIKAGLNFIARKAGPSDLVLIYIASHGTSRDKVGDVNYILVSDTDNNDPDKLFGTALAMSDISDTIRSRVKALRTVVLLDTCYGGAGGKGMLRVVSPPVSTMDKMKAGAGRAVIASSGHNQKSYESLKLKHGVFTHYFVEALKQQDGKMPLYAIFNFVRLNVSKQVREELDAEQTPELFRSDQGTEIVIGVEPANVSAALPVATPTLRF